jgi:class 3 adenylate cyclase
MDDVRAVIDAVGLDRVGLFGMSEGGSMCALFAATYPERSSALVLYGAFAKRLWSADYPWAPTPEERQNWLGSLEKGWGGEGEIATLAPTLANDERFKRWFSTYGRMSASPGEALALGKMNTYIDIRHVLPTIHVPTLVIHRSGDLDVSIGNGRYLAQSIPGAKSVELPGNDHWLFAGDTDAVLNEIEEFLTGVKTPSRIDRVLATVLFTDIVDSTRRANELGDEKWKSLLVRHNEMIRRELVRFRGREVKSTGDGFLVTFDGPARAVKCAFAIRDAIEPLGISIRAGLHTGECELMGDDIGGISVHIAARVAEKAKKNEVLVSSTVKDLVSGSGIQFTDRGSHALKGLTERWHLFGAEEPG